MAEVIVIGGANGAGKSTFARSVLPSAMPFLNADDIARELEETGATNRDREAARIFLAQMEEHVKKLCSFALETTLASRSLAPRLRELQSQGWKIHLVFFHLPSPELAIARVACRVRRGGHDIPADVIQRRYTRGIRNFRTLYAPFVDSCLVLANDDETGPTLRNNKATNAASPLGKNAADVVQRAQAGVREALLGHKAAQNAIAVARAGRVEIIPAERIMSAHPKESK